VVSVEVEVLLRHPAEGVQVEYTCVSTGRRFLDGAGISKFYTFYINSCELFFLHFAMLIIGGSLAEPTLAPFSSAASIGGKSLSFTHQNATF
jgi:hypothetical protein